MLSTSQVIAGCELLEDAKNYLLVDKHPGYSVHRDSDSESLLDRLRAETSYSYLAPVHRLDRVTSGLWLLAKNPESAAALSGQFEQRKVEKYYLALSDRKPRKKQGAVEGAIVSARGGSYRLARSGEPWSRTRFFSYGLGNGQRLFLLRPLTGRTHQLRVVMKSLGAPILGDERYGAPGQDRCYLHAYALVFSLNGESIVRIRPPSQGRCFQDAAFVEKLVGLAAPWDLAWPR